METNYKKAAKFYGTVCVALLIYCTGITIMYFREASVKRPNDSYWSKKYDSLYVKCNEKDSYIVVPKKRDTKFDLFRPVE